MIRRRRTEESWTSFSLDGENFNSCVDEPQHECQRDQDIVRVLAKWIHSQRISSVAEVLPRNAAPQTFYALPRKLRYWGVHLRKRVNDLLGKSLLYIGHQRRKALFYSSQSPT